MVREESHLDDMRAAIRGDFERLAERRGSQELMREGEAEPDVEGENAPSASAPPTDAKPAREHQSWLDRVLGRSHRR